MQIFVAGSSTKAIQLFENSVQELKDQVQQSFGIPTDEQVLRLGGKLLQSEAAFKHEQLRDSMTVHLSMRLRGGRGELEATDVDGCLPVDFLDVSQLPPPTMEREMSHGTAAAHDFCIPEAEASSSEKQSESLDKDNDYYDDASKPPDFERGDSLLNSIDAGGPSCPSPTQQQHAFLGHNIPAPVATSLPKPANTVPVSCGMKRPLESTPLPSRGYGGTVPPMPGGVPMPAFPGALAMGFQHGPFGPARQIPFFPASVPHPALVHKRQKGLAYDLDLVDDKLKKRLLKNRQSAERSRQKKNAMMKGLEEQLQDSKDDAAALRNENELLRAQLAAHRVPLPEGVSEEAPCTPSTARVKCESVDSEGGMLDHADAHESAGSADSEA